ncbi:AraC family transcriptional regulator [Bradyrhizobium sp. KB893862 SZCCT0404]|nr:AraC family transcriptional regulator [Bradyrhizobium sp. KB893862 SZCCT0404]MBR1177133.1 AraC family transcriptional regulator [Bradyrhizobium sp. KB893862 SZCCT0404]
MREASIITGLIADALLATIAARGGDVETLAAKFGGPSVAGGADIWPLAKFTAMLEAAAVEKGDPLFGLTLGKAFQLSGLGPIAPLMMASQTGADAFSKFTRYFPAFQNNTHYGFALNGDVARLSYLITDPTVKLRKQDALFTIALEHSILTTLLGMEVSPLWIDFQHAPSSDTIVAEYRTFFRCEVRFGRNENAIYFPAANLGESAKYSDPNSSAKLEAELVDSIRAREQHLGFSASIEAWMTSALSAGMNIDVENAASDFGMSLRSFQRKLYESDINYLDLRNKVRLHIAKSLLKMTSIPITSIAFYLGYSETSAFCRHFKKMSHVTPLQFRHGVASADLPMDFSKPN